MSVSDADQPQSRDEFVRLLRSRAERAADASVHFATLAQKYHELSLRLAALAESSDGSTLAELRSAVLDMECATDTPADTWHVPADERNDPLPRSTADADRAAWDSADTESAEADPILPEAGAPSDQSSTSPRNRPSRRPRERPRKLSTREQVERFRTAKRTRRRRIRVKSKKSDRRPGQRSTGEDLRKGGTSILSSVVLVTIALFLLRTMTWQIEAEPVLDPIVCRFATNDEPEAESQPLEPPEQIQQETDDATEPPEPVPDEQPEQFDQEPMEQATSEPAMADVPETDTDGKPSEVKSTVLNATDLDAAAVDNRSDEGRKALLQKYGGSEDSEAAVQKALEWLASVQHPQGYWDFVNVGAAGNAGTVNNPIGGTAYALLPFLAAGQSHRVGQYQREVGAGLTYLTRVGIQAPAGYDLRGIINKRSDDKSPNEAYYVHGAATQALCEAWYMTKDGRLRRPAEEAVRFLINSQDPVGGGWRYNPRDAGSTSVTVVQVMALSAAEKCGIEVPKPVLDRIRRYVDSVQVDGDGRYGYDVARKHYTGPVSAMALLSRIYLGWGRNDGDLRAGVARLDKAGPWENIYSVYFATQVMKHWGGEEWQRWNARVRDDLVATQATEGAAGGSWKPRTSAIHARQGGRLLTTVLATMTLQVYYRYKPLLPEATSDTGD